MILFAAGLLPLWGITQSLTPFVVAATGGFYTGVNGSLAYTVGEMAAVETFQSADNFLTQGFHQPDELVPPAPLPPEDLSLYPNPTPGEFFYEFMADEDAEKEVVMYNDIGQLVRIFKFKQTVGLNKFRFDISVFSQGMYLFWMEMKDVDGNLKPITKKVNLIQ